MANPNGKRLEALKQRETELRAQIAAERVKLQRREFREYERLKSIVGGACLEVGAKDRAVELMLKTVLATATLIESEKKMLRAKGWI